MPQTAKAYSLKLYDAIELAARAHHGQVRKGTEIPYLGRIRWRWPAS